MYKGCDRQASSPEPFILCTSQNTAQAGLEMGREFCFAVAEAEDFLALPNIVQCLHPWTGVFFSDEHVLKVGRKLKSPLRFVTMSELKLSFSVVLSMRPLSHVSSLGTPR